jgi:hypothetical protein
MQTPPAHVLARLDDIIVGQEEAKDGGGTPPRHVLLQNCDDDDDDDDAAFGIESSATSFSEPVEDESGGARTATSRFWGVYWHRGDKKWRARYRDANGKIRHIGNFDGEEEAARAVNKAIRDAGLEGKRHMNEIDATGRLVPRERHSSQKLDRSAVVAPGPERDPTATTSKYWGVSWSKSARRWQAVYRDANGKLHHIGVFDTQEKAAHAVNAAIRRAGLEGKRRTNPVVDGQLVPRKRTKKANGHGPCRKRRRR